MNRSGRMFAIVVDLEARRIVRAEDRAARYETSVRTIYRDISALCEAGIPVVSLPGQGYALPPDYFLPPLSFGVDEAGALLLGAAMSQRRSIPRIGQRHRAPRPKIEAIGPDAVWQAFPSPATLAAADETELAAVLHHTVAGRRVAACARARSAPRAKPNCAPLPTQELAAWLRGLDAIGDCSRGFILIRRFGRMERLSTTDDALLRAVSDVHGDATLRAGRTN
jgi:predicted DNA-binding transcriptional regulator YafY